MYFIDPSLAKNKNYYATEIKKIQSDYKIHAKLCYGKELWDEICHPEVWNELLNYLEKWKKEIPDMPSINFDDEAEKTFEEIKNIEASVFRKLFNNKIVCNEILPILFPKNESLELLYKHFSEHEKQNSIYKTLSYKIMEYLKLS